MTDHVLLQSSRLTWGWRLFILVPAAVCLVDAAIVRLPGGTLYVAVAIAIVGGCGCVLMSNERFFAKLVAMCITIVLIIAEIMTLGWFFLMVNGLSGTQ